MSPADAPVFLDVEASGIAAGSYPVEIGWARSAPASADARWIEVASLLVRPPPHWLARQDAWDPAAEPVHGLLRQTQLREGVPPAAACAALATAFQGARVVTDTGSAGWDADWLAALHEAGGSQPSWALDEREAGRVLGDRFRALGLDPRVCRPALRPWAPKATHAAAEDAYVFAWQWAMADVLAENGFADLAPKEAAAALSELPARIPAGRWPQIAATGRFRRRF